MQQNSKKRETQSLGLQQNISPIAKTRFPTLCSNVTKIEYNVRMSFYFHEEGKKLFYPSTLHSIYCEHHIIWNITDYWASKESADLFISIKEEQLVSKEVRMWNVQTESSLFPVHCLLGNISSRTVWYFRKNHVK